MENEHLFGLKDIEVTENRKQYGKNILTPPPKVPLWKKFFLKFTEPIIVILLIAFVLSIGVSIYEYIRTDEGFKILLEPIGIFIALFLATFVAFVYETKAEKKFDSLSKINDEDLVKVKRNGNIIQIMKIDVVVGDIVILETGDEIPADGELIEAISLHVNESSLTGELMCRKTTNKNDLDPDATYPSNFVLKATSVIEGHAIMKVTKVGDTSEYGKVYKGAQIENNIQTPLNIQLTKLAKIISYFAYIIAAAIIIARSISFFYLNDDYSFIEFITYSLKSVMLAITLIVVSVPEGLPMCITLSLALSMKRMLATNNLVRKMHACETMGAATVICTDKTGTLTQNQMRVYESLFSDLPEQKLDDTFISTIISEGISINSTAFLDKSNKDKINVIGNPTEGALLLWLNNNNIDYLYLRENIEIIAQLPFSTERKYMATIYYSEKLGKNILFVKGASEIILENCNNPSNYKQSISDSLLLYQNKAMRTLGFAYKIINNDDEIKVLNQDKKLAEDLIFIGIVAISDPIRSDVAEAIQDCIVAGVDIKIVTGDTPNTTKEIARQLGLWQQNEPERHHLTGKEFNEMKDEDLVKIIKEIKILSRARPSDKERLVRLLQGLGEVVAVTGDGTNDAPALNVAQVGLSMGDGTAVAKEASDITILDNSFYSISRAIMWGRSLYQNIQRFILFQLTINLIACIIVLIGSILGAESPLTVTQMLWVNLIMDTFAAMALASLPPDKKVLKNKPRKIKDHILTSSMIKNIIFVGLILVIVLFALFQYFKFTEINSLLDFNFYDYVRNFFNFSNSGHLNRYELTLFFTFFVMFQFWNIFNAKSFFTGKSAFKKMKESKDFLLIAVIILIGQIFIVNVGGHIFNVVPIKLIDWIIIIFITSFILIFGEFFRLIKKIF